MLSVPWFFSSDSQHAFLGVPWWVVYSLGATGVAACTLGVGLRWWDRLADEAQRVHRDAEDL